LSDQNLTTFFVCTQQIVDRLLPIWYPLFALQGLYLADFLRYFQYSTIAPFDIENGKILNQNFISPHINPEIGFVSASIMALLLRMQTSKYESAARAHVEKIRTFVLKIK